MEIILAFVQAGIEDHLILALEPECAALYCMLVPDQHLTREVNGRTESLLKTGNSVMVMDVGGTVHF